MIRRAPLRVEVQIVYNSHTTPEDAAVALQRIADARPDFVVTSTLNIAAKVRDLQRGRPPSTTVRFADHDAAFQHGLAAYARSRGWRHRILSLRESRLQPDIEEIRATQRQFQERKHFRTVTLDKQLENTLLNGGELDENVAREWLRNELESYLVRGEHFRRALFDVPALVLEHYHDRTGQGWRGRKMKIVVVTSRKYKPMVENVVATLGRTPPAGPISVDINAPDATPDLARVRYLHEAARQAEVAAQQRRGILKFPLTHLDMDLTPRRVRRIIFEEFAERALRHAMPNSPRRFALIRSVADQLAEEHLDRFVSDYLTRPRDQHSNQQILYDFLSSATYGEAGHLGPKSMGEMMRRLEPELSQQLEPRKD